MDFKYFAIQTKGGRDYVAKIDINAYGIRTGKVNEDSKSESLLDFNPNTKFIALYNPTVLMPVQGNAGKPQMIPIKFSEIPTGSEVLHIEVSNIAEINMISDDSDFAKALKAQESKLVLSSNAAELEKSSRVVHKFGR
jgi:hypothetical protein